MPANGSNGPVHAMCGDLAHPQSIWLFGGHVNLPVGTPERAFSQLMSGVGVAVEWGFGQIVSQWSCLDFKQNMKMLKTPTAQHHMNCAFLCNLHSCVCGDQKTVHFNADALSLEQHLALVSWTLVFCLHDTSAFGSQIAPCCLQIRRQMVKKVSNGECANTSAAPCTVIFQ